jgi:integrase/recombinase XerD
MGLLDVHDFILTGFNQSNFYGKTPSPGILGRRMATTELDVPARSAPHHQTLPKRVCSRKRIPLENSPFQSNVSQHILLKSLAELKMPISGEQAPLSLTLETLLVGFSDDGRKKTAETLLNTLEGQIENLNTRQAYKVAWGKFFKFCSKNKLELNQVRPFHFELWRNLHTGGVATQRQHLAAVRLLFDELLRNGIVDLNPAARVKVPRLNRALSHTPIFEPEEIKSFMDSLEPVSLIEFRDRALFSTMLYTWARVSAVIALQVEDYYLRKGNRWLRLKEKRGNINEVPVHSVARNAIDEWLRESGLNESPAMPLFPAFSENRELITSRHMTRVNVWGLVQTRARAAGLKKRIGCHSFRATGLTAYMNAGGQLDIAQRIAGHSQLSTTKIYDRSKDRVTIEEIEKVSFQDEKDSSATLP